MVRLLWSSYDALVEQEEQWRQRLTALAKTAAVVGRFEAVPGVGWIRAATLYAYLDTPWRFRSKAALWKYLGIGLERQRSGNGPEHLGVPLRAHRLLSGDHSRSGTVGGSFGKQSVRRLVSEVDRGGPLVKASTAQCCPCSGSDVMGHVEKRQRVPPGMGGCGCGRQPGDQGVSVRTVAVSVRSGVPTGGLDPPRRSSLDLNEPASCCATLSNLHGPLGRVPDRWLGDVDRPLDRRESDRAKAETEPCLEGDSLA
jgi:hypothetical protein